MSVGILIVHVIGSRFDCYSNREMTNWACNGQNAKLASIAIGVAISACDLQRPSSETCTSVNQPADIGDSFVNPKTLQGFTLDDLRAAHDGTYNCNIVWTGGQNSDFKRKFEPSSGTSAAILQIHHEAPIERVVLRCTEPSHDRTYMQTTLHFDLKASDETLVIEMRSIELTSDPSEFQSSIDLDESNQGSYHLGYFYTSPVEMRNILDITSDAQGVILGTIRAEIPEDKGSTTIVAAELTCIRDMVNDQ